MLFLLAAVWFVWSSRRYPGREESVYREPRSDGGTEGGAPDGPESGSEDASESEAERDSGEPRLR